MKRFGKRAQIFLLAAVIISLVVISLGITANQANVKKEPTSFEDFTFEVKRETGAVVDFEIYSGFDDGANLTDFVILLAKDIKDKDPNVDFLFLYGNNDEMTLKNYGNDSVSAGGGSIPGPGFVPGQICFGVGPCTTITIGMLTIDENIGTGTIIPGGANNITIKVFGQPFNLPISEHRQVIFIIQKIVEDENYIFIR